ARYGTRQGSAAGCACASLAGPLAPGDVSSPARTRPGNRRGGRVVECTWLEIRQAFIAPRGFESPPLRQMQIKRPPRGAFLFASGERAWFEPLGSTAREAGGARRAAPRNPPSMRYWGRCRPFYLHPVRGAWFAPARPPAKPVARGALCPVTDRASVCTEKPPAGPSESPLSV